jgi:heavy metal efflux system protein
MKLIRFFLEQRGLSFLLAITILGAGVWGWKQLPVDAFPDVTNIQVMVLSQAPGLTTAEVERQISYPIEMAMAGLPRVTDVWSLSKNGLSQVRIIFEEGTEIYFARQLIHERLAEAKEHLPPGVEVELGPISTGLGEIFQYTLETGYSCKDHPQVWSAQPGNCPKDNLPLVKPDLNAMDLRTIQDWDVALRLKGIPGVNEVNSFGGFVKQVHVVPTMDKLRKYGLTLRDVLEALAANNANAGGGFVVTGGEQSYIVTSGLIRSQEDLEKIVLRAENGTPVQMKEVATVSIGAMTRQGAVTRDGRGEVVAGMVIMLKGENSREVVDQVKERVDEIQRSLPAGVKIRPFYDRTTLIDASINTITKALVEGGIFVILILFLFLWDFRGALVVALSLPLTAALVFLLMDTAQVTANLMTLGGLAIAIGMVVDGTIVIVENIVGMMRSPENSKLSRIEIALKATREVARPVFFSIVVITLVLLPLFTLEAIEGKMFRPMALTIILAMASSLVVALLIVPSVSATLCSRKPEHSKGNPVVRLMVRLYRPTLDWALNHRLILVVVLLLALAGTGFISTKLGTEFLPPLDEGAIAVNVVRLPSASLNISAAQATALEEQILLHIPEAETVVSKTGRPEIAEDPMGPEQNDILVMLKPRSEWRPGTTQQSLVGELNRIFLDSPGIRPSFSQPIALRVNELISGVKSDVAIKIFGDDLDQLRTAAEAIAPQLAAIPGASDVKVEQSSGLLEIQVIPKREKLSRYNMNIEDLNETIRTAVGGTVVGYLYQGQRWFGIQVRIPESERNSIAAIKRIPLDSPEGNLLFLGDLATVEEVEAPAQISRENSKRRLLVECNVRGRDLGSFVAEAKTRLRPLEAKLPTGSYLTWGGQFENQERASRRLAWVVPIVLILIIFMQLSALGNIPSTLLVILNLPFSVVGGLLVIWMAGLNISVSVLVGLIALFGMAVQHGTVLVSFIDELRGRGMAVEEAVREACVRRLRPLLMTKLTSVLGLLPILFTSGPGSDIQKPLALVVLGGLVVTTLLNTHIVPALYGWFHRFDQPQSH